MLRASYKKIRSVLPAASAVFLAACTDLSAVRDWSAASLQAAQFNQIVATYADTPNRLAVYDEPREARWREIADQRARQAEALELQLALVADYMAALAALSADHVTGFEKSAEGLTASLGQTGVVDQPAMGVVAKLATTLGRAALGLWQKDEVGDLIEEANTPLQTMLRGGLYEIVDFDFREDIELEASVMRNHYDALLVDDASASPAATEALREWQSLRRVENARRMQALDAYLLVLEKIADGHQRLYDSRDDLDAADLARDLFKLAKDIRRHALVIVKA